MLITYILPVYGVEKYISACLDSIYSQDISENDFEVICVDDCTKDKSCDIIQQYQQVHSNIILIHHEVNKKAGGARNTGLRYATGKYIWFVDADDMLVPNTANTLLHKCEEDELDVLCFNLLLKDGENITKECVFSQEFRVTSGVKILNDVFGDGIIYNLGYPVRSIYRRSLLIDNKICFPEGMTFGEDTTFMTESICAAERVTCIPTYAYYYVLNQQSSSAQLFTNMRGELIYQSCIQAGDMVVRLCNSVRDKSPELAANIERGIPWFVNRLYIRLVKTDYRERRRFYKKLKESNNESHAAFTYMDTKNRFIVKHHISGLFCLNILSSLYKIKHAKQKI